MLDDFKIFLRWVKTYDEADDIWDEFYPVDMEYLRFLADELQYGDPEPLWIPKSRRLMVTWTLCAWMLWRACKSKAFHGFIQSKREEDSAYFIEHRVKYIWDRLPYWFRFCICGGPPSINTTHLKLEIPTGGKVWGIPQGAAIFAGYTPSALFVDEAEKQPQFEDAVATIMPFAEKKTKLVFVSSAEGNYFGEVVESPVEGDIEEPLRGIKKWSLRNGGRVCQIHYTADPNKDPLRHGKAFLERMDRIFIGGLSGWKWRQEMEIEFNARSGALVFPQYKDESPIVIDPNEYFGDFHPSLFEERYRAIDWGLRNPTACVWIGLLDQEWYIYREYYQTGTTVEAFKQEIRSLSGSFDSDGRWVAEDYKFTIIDPASDRKNFAGMRTVYHLLNTGADPLYAIKANNSDDGIHLINEWLYQERLHIFKELSNTRWEFRNYRWDEHSEGIQYKHNLKEKPIDKDNHILDSVKYFANLVRAKENLWRIEREKQKDQFDPEIMRLLGSTKNRYHKGKVLRYA